MLKIVIGKPISKEEDLLRTKFPALFNHPIHWPVLKKTLASTEASPMSAEMQADEQAREILKMSPILGNRNKTAVKHRIGRKEYLRFQRDLENGMKLDIFDRMANKLSKMLLNAADGSGKIPLHKSKPIMARVKDINTKGYKEMENGLTAGVTKSIRFGLLVSMDSAQDGLNRQKQIEETYPVAFSDAAFELIEAEKKAVIAKTSTVFKTIFDRVKKRRIKQGIFKNRIRGAFQSGFKLSQAVWDLRDANLRRLRNVVAPGIAQGRSAISMASEIKKMTTVGVGGVKGVTSAGRGVAKSAFKNALRMTRTETNNAYHEAELEYARKKGYKKKWNLAAGHLETDICDELAQGGPAGDGVYPAELVPPLPHPSCSCYLTTVIPGVS